MKIKVIKLIISILIVQLAGIIGSIFTSSSVSTWYQSLVKPSFTPPNWIFGPVWIILYLLMGIALYLVWGKGFKNKGVKIAVYIFILQLILNLLWSFLFFGLNNPLYAFIEIIVLWILILINIILFYRISKTSAYLLLPYIFWVTFAAVLNFTILLLN